MKKFLSSLTFNFAVAALLCGVAGGAHYECFRPIITFPITSVAAAVSLTFFLRFLNEA